MIVAIKEEKKYLLWLLFFYTLSQGLILIVSGMWFDDWCIVNISDAGLKMWALELGKPEVYPIVSFLIVVPEIIYKLMIFIGYYIVTVALYLIIKKSLLYKSIDAFCMTLIYLSMPVNDARIERLGMMYTIGLTLFFVAACLFIYKYEEMKIVPRLIILSLFFFSYILNSMLVFMGLVWLYIFVREKNIKRIIRKADFFALPFLFYIIKHVFFHESGVYAGYNAVSLRKMVDAIRSSIEAASELVSVIIPVFTNVVISTPIYLLLMFVATCVIIKVGFGTNDKENIGQAESKSEVLVNIGMELFFGCITLFAGIYPYVVVGNGVTTLTGFDSRNGILTSFGLAFILHAIFRIGLKREYRSIVVLFMLMVSVYHFTYAYAGYQGAYYMDRGLQEYLKLNPNLKQYKNIGLIENDGGSSWYINNGIFEEVYGDENRLVENFNHIMSMDPEAYTVQIEREWYNMSDVDPTYKPVDCVILYSNSFSNRQAMSARIYEILGEDISERLLANSSFQVIYPGDEDFAKYVVE